MHLLVHIGPHKTGTTSIQKTLHANNDRLSRQGILPFFVGPHQTRDLSLRFSHSRELRHPNVIEKFGTEGAAIEHSKNCWHELRHQVRKSQAPVGIISSEHFSTLEDPVAFYRLLKRMAERVTVISYVRDPVELFVSSLQEQIKGKGAFKLSQSVSEYKLRYRRFLAPAVAEIGQADMIVRCFDRSNLHEGSVVSDFFKLVSNFMPVDGIVAQAGNESVPGAVLAWMIRQETRSGTQMDHRERYRLIKKLSRSEDIAQLPRLRMESSTWEATIRSNNREICEWVNATFLTGQTQLKTSPESPMPDRHCDHKVFSDLGSWVASYLTETADRLISDALAT